MRGLLSLCAVLLIRASSALPGAKTAQPMPDIPDGVFAGYNNADGTTTLVYRDRDLNFTYTPQEPAVTKRELPVGNLEKRYRFNANCLDGEKLDERGVTEAMIALRDHIIRTPYIGVGQLNDWPPYFGYNMRGVFVYVCRNSDSGHRYWALDELETANSQLSNYCGHYYPGEIPSKDEVDIFGRVQSGVKVCSGNPREAP